MPRGIPPCVLAGYKLAGEKLTVELDTVPIETADDFDPVFVLMIRHRVGGFVVLGSPLAFSYRVRLVELALKHGLPGSFDFREYVEAGGFISYGPDVDDLHRRAAVYIDKILKGARSR
jgi:putative tryptophan/tyrosine transport system substrate-binding protein